MFKVDIKTAPLSRFAPREKKQQVDQHVVSVAKAFSKEALQTEELARSLLYFYWNLKIVSSTRDVSNLNYY